MLYYLFEYLQKCDFPGAGMFTYVTFRAIFAIITSLVISIWFGEYFIKLLKRRQISETQRDESIDPFNTQKKRRPDNGRNNNYNSNTGALPPDRKIKECLYDIDDNHDSHIRNRRLC